MISSDDMRDLFSLIDRRDAAAFASHFAADGLFRFGNQPPLRGAAAIAPVVSGFFSTLSGIDHRLEDVWPLADATLCHGRVKYSRSADDALEVPFAVIAKGAPDAITEYLIFVDNSALAAPSDGT